ncbi:hypothetical protein ACTOB_004772 [Actinoplanes oblitus]|uniref:Uncharacterized protein n=1 Tax=Actinoplanes oblitus TaxID=3040509 RepID=A0ABY8W4N3_9ACTN|nr:hypothetical protein [Actinoplanes oblitus]WIM92814.1 hypothetical protein ACTOB_004772 [Actinoplanes oblitus]
MRADLHNVSIDEGLARHGLCGQIHLPSGRRCVRPHRHAGPCHFVHPADLDRLIPDSPVDSQAIAPAVF